MASGSFLEGLKGQQFERGVCCRIHPPKSGLTRFVTFQPEADTMWLKCRSTTSCATARHVPTHHALYTLQNKLLSSTKQKHSRKTRTDYLLSPAARPRRRATTTLYNMLSILPQVVLLTHLFIGHWRTPKTAFANHHARSATWHWGVAKAEPTKSSNRRSPC